MPRPSPALVVALLALFVALGGTGYAALVAVPKNSVGTKQLKNGAVTGTKLGSGAVSAKKIANGAVGAKQLNVAGVTVPNALHANSADSATNATNATNAAIATNATNAGNATNLGGQSAGSYLRYGTTLLSGATETGVWGAAGVATGAAGSANSDSETATFASFPVPLAAALDAAHVVLIGNSFTSTCPGLGHAAPGYLCVYEVESNNASVSSSGSIISPENAESGASPRGFGIGIDASGQGYWYDSGSWAVTAP